MNLANQEYTRLTPTASAPQAAAHVANGHYPYANSPRQLAQAARIAQLRAAAAAAPKAASTASTHGGLPQGLRSGIEAISGVDMSGVRVHRNSDKPAQLNAHAYAQGQDIHLGPGQEKHLAHEAWHVVQQAQGRVKPTMQMAGAVAVNADASLEREADVMGARLMHYALPASDGVRLPRVTQMAALPKVTQRVTEVTGKTQKLRYMDNGNAHWQLAGATIDAYLDPKDPITGSAPGVGIDYRLYPLLNSNFGVSFIKGHLLNANLGGPGLPQNLFPITEEANHAHSSQVEETVKSNLLALAKNNPFVRPQNAALLHYSVRADWLGGSNDFLADPKSELYCSAEFVDAQKKTVAELVKPTTIISDPAGARPVGKNEELRTMGWGSLGSGFRAVNEFTVEEYSNNHLVIKGPQWDNQNKYVGRKVHLTFT